MTSCTSKFSFEAVETSHAPLDLPHQLLGRRHALSALSLLTVFSAVLPRHWRQASWPPSNLAFANKTRGCSTHFDLHLCMHPALIHDCFVALSFQIHL